MQEERNLSIQYYKSNKDLPRKWSRSISEVQQFSLQMLPNNSIFSQTAKQTHKNNFIFTNFYGDLLHKESLFAQIQYFQGDIQKNIVRLDDSLPAEYPMHQTVSFNSFLKDLYVFYLNIENSKRQDIFFYDDAKYKFEYNYPSQNQGIYQQLIEEHEQGSIIIILYNGLQKQTQITQHFEVNNQLKGQKINCQKQNNRKLLFFYNKTLKKSIKITTKQQITQNNLNTYELTENETIILFDLVLNCNILSKLLTDDYQFDKIVNNIRCNNKSIDNVINRLREKSFTRQYNYSELYSIDNNSAILQQQQQKNKIENTNMTKSTTKTKQLYNNTNNCQDELNDGLIIQNSNQQSQDKIQTINESFLNQLNNNQILSNQQSHEGQQISEKPKN